jgi:hypothetical protein
LYAFLVFPRQATRPDAYWLYFHNVFYYAPLGFATMFAHRTDSKWFIIAYTLMAAYFSRKMVRGTELYSPDSDARRCVGDPQDMHIKPIQSPAASSFHPSFTVRPMDPSSSKPKFQSVPFEKPLQLLRL